MPNFRSLLRNFEAFPMQISERNAIVIILKKEKLLPKGTEIFLNKLEKMKDVLFSEKFQY